MKDTIVVNLFAGPGAGKSTGAAYVFSKLKLAGIDAEYVSEFAKDKVWENNAEVFKCQPYISGKQIFKISRCYGKVDVIITDSPILLGAIYGNDNEAFTEALKFEFKRFKNYNVFIHRVKDYNPNGRNQTEAEAKQIDENLLNWLSDNKISLMYIDGNEQGYNELADTIISILKK